MASQDAVREPIRQRALSVLALLTYDLYMRATTLLLLSLSVLPGCFISRRTIDNPIQHQGLADLVPGETTAGQAA